MKFEWFKQNSNLILIVILVVGIVGLTLSSLLLILENNKELPLSSGEVLYLNELTGLMSHFKVSTNPVAVMIENATEIRPQSGLSEAEIVYEALVEGGITRFMAVYNFENLAKKIGPVRSVRPYFLDWAEEYQPAFFHVGGSPQALETIADYSIIDINEMGANEIYFLRGIRSAWPHNVYTNSSLWQTIPELESRKIDFEPWQFIKVNEIFCPTDGQEIIIDFSYFNYQVKWVYDCQFGSYQRFNGGQEHLDENGVQLITDKVIIQFVKSWLIDIERLGMQTTGEGKALIFQNGQVTEGSWQKKEQESRTKFLNIEGEEVLFIPGKTWLEIVPPLTNIDY